MQITGTNLAPPLIASPLPKESLLRNLQPGQIQQARVLSENQNGNIKLQIGIAKLTAQTQLSVRPGQSLILQVSKTGELPEFKILSPPSPEQLKASALKNLLPRQQPIPILLEKLLRTSGNDSKAPLPTEIKQAFVSLLARLPSPDNGDFRLRLAQAVRNNGLFTEARLLAGITQDGDPKLNLQRLKHFIEATLARRNDAATEPPGKDQQTARETLSTTGIRLLNDLLKQLDATLARIQTHQLNSLQQDESGNQTWRFELPILHGEKIDNLQILLRRERATAGEEEETIWRLTLQMNLPPLGAMRVQLSLRGEAISTLIWTDRESTRELVYSHLDILRQAYETAGLEIQKLEAHRGRIEQVEPMPDKLQLLREKA